MTTYADFARLHREFTNVAGEYASALDQVGYTHGTRELMDRRHAKAIEFLNAGEAWAREALDAGGGVAAGDASEAAEVLSVFARHLETRHDYQAQCFDYPIRDYDASPHSARKLQELAAKFGSDIDALAALYERFKTLGFPTTGFDHVWHGPAASKQPIASTQRQTTDGLVPSEEKLRSPRRAKKAKPRAADTMSTTLAPGSVATHATSRSEESESKKPQRASRTKKSRHASGHDTKSSNDSGNVPRWIAPTAFVTSIALLLLIVSLVFAFEPTPSQFVILRIIIALAGAAFALGLTGFLSVKLDLGRTGVAITAGGTLAVFVIIFFFTPPPHPSPVTPVLEPLPATTGTVASPRIVQPGTIIPEGQDTRPSAPEHVRPENIGPPAPSQEGTGLSQQAHTGDHGEVNQYQNVSQ